MSDAGKREYVRQVERGDRGPEMQSIARGTYGSIARSVDIAMNHGHRPCLGEPCDLDAPCRRHAETTTVVSRYLRYCDSVVKTCGCGAEYSRRTWAKLHLVGGCGDEFERAILRNCTCGLTISRVTWRAPCRVCGEKAWDLDYLGAICEPCFDALDCEECGRVIRRQAHSPRLLDRSGEESCDCSGLQLSAHEDHMVDEYMERD